jgi:hypothetical protein
MAVNRVPVARGDFSSRSGPPPRRVMGVPLRRVSAISFRRALRRDEAARSVEPRLKLQRRL